ncbi:hypothetical protein THAOC_37323 [Thalassiosira oceanica]|uniref:Uncharacterized protein n=1 Tax=Thalassiosira oceanica TaxID=159749 RepID=K0R0E0_THAOC|nr:hypothetical protein THAOC_37323 [Thalassiosira oceanica]|eukprot:EJK44164.1 hypothetical protein THAOC_37323 [Thalassiosira oceanica]
MSFRLLRLDLPKSVCRSDTAYVSSVFDLRSTLGSFYYVEFRSPRDRHFGPHRLRLFVLPSILGFVGDRAPALRGRHSVVTSTLTLGAQRKNAHNIRSPSEVSDVSGRAGRELGSQNPETVTMISTCGLAELKGLTGAQHFLLLAATALLFNCRITDAGDDAPAVVVKVTEALKVSAQSSLLNMTFDPVFDDDDATLNTLAQAYCLNYTPATSTTQTQTSPNNEGATADTFDYVVESDPKGKYGFIFLPGMGESSNSTVEDGSPNRRFIDGLLERLPGKMIVLQALPDYDKLYFLPRETGDREVLNQGVDPLTCLMREGTCAACHPPEDVNAFWRTGQGASWMNPSDETNGCFEKQTHDSKRWEKVTTSNFDRIKEYVGGFVSEDG